MSNKHYNKTLRASKLNKKTILKYSIAAVLAVYTSVSVYFIDFKHSLDTEYTGELVDIGNKVSCYNSGMIYDTCKLKFKASDGKTKEVFIGTSDVDKYAIGENYTVHIARSVLQPYNRISIELNKQ